METTILRNRGQGRKDAAYVVKVWQHPNESPPSNFWVTAYYGAWANFESDQTHLTGLREVEKGRRMSARLATSTARRLTDAKLGRGYVIWQRLPPQTNLAINESDPEPAPVKEPEPIPEPKSKWDENHMVNKLLRRAG